MLHLVILDDKPRKSELYSLGIIDDITDYDRVGTYLLKDEKGNIIRNLREDHKYVRKIVIEIFDLWLNDKGATPVTWAGLINCLRLAELNTLADKIESAYQCAEKSHGSHETVTTPPIIQTNENLADTEYGKLLMRLLMRLQTGNIIILCIIVATMGIAILLFHIGCRYRLSGLFLQIISLHTI